MTTNRIPWPAESVYEARVDRGLVYYRAKGKGTEEWQHLDARDSAVTRAVYTFAGDSDA